MKTIFTLILLFSTTLVLQAQNTIEVSISGFDNNIGKAIIGLYNTESDFLEKEYKSATSEIIKKHSTALFTDIPDGIYAVSVFHDEDNDNEFDMLFGFIPMEDYGNSNNVPPRFGPPKWDDAKFEIKGGEIKNINIKMM
ncbi:DUF2141 domain-containing protein [Aequorivita capsosiphonis]|uniref:DUF2141 domain-containing protein n=1 Tax=Aequorivita capsosiphonis TaxID=487317 RepID=UPI00041C046B|nr:DUF2141 domain-containing protein [Aequorivita capsosiphonis]